MHNLAHSAHGGSPQDKQCVAPPLTPQKEACFQALGRVHCAIGRTTCVFLCRALLLQKHRVTTATSSIHARPPCLSDRPAKNTLRLLLHTPPMSTHRYTHPLRSRHGTLLLGSNRRGQQAKHPPSHHRHQSHASIQGADTARHCLTCAPTLNPQSNQLLSQLLQPGIGQGTKHWPMQTPVQAFLNVRTQHSKGQRRPPCLCCHRHYLRLSKHWRPNAAAAPALSLPNFTACQDSTLSLSVWCRSAAQLLSCAVKQAQARPNDAALSCIRRTAGCAGARPGACCPAAAPYR